MLDKILRVFSHSKDCTKVIFATKDKKQEKFFASVKIDDLLERAG